ncbi:MAG: glycosyltransferase family 4 protein, partial [Elusimicrobiota bacterium]|nr:glycosyltransferase family 4 protein [Endomicrobiia bacterium]MDW8166620.1 glycosyltransferase family 4 protein [Elusimicrobiota bacterium]
MHPELIYPRGAEKQVCMLSYYLAKFGHDVTIYTFEKKEPYIYDHLLEKVEVYSLKKKWAIGYPSVDVPRWSYLIKKISKKIESKNHEIINAHNHPAQWISYYTKKTVVWSCNEPYLYYQEKRDFKSNFYIWIDKHLSKKVKLILCLDPMMEEIIRSRYLNIKTFVTWSGVELNQEVEHIENDCFDVL